MDKEEEFRRIYAFIENMQKHHIAARPPSQEEHEKAITEFNSGKRR